MNDTKLDVIHIDGFHGSSGSWELERFERYTSLLVTAS